MKICTENILEVIQLPATCAEVYNTFIDEKKHAEFTEMASSISPVVGGEFTACDGRAIGTILQLSKNKRIVVAWTHKRFPKHHFTIVDIKLEATVSGCRINFNHIGVPQSCDGWMTETWQKTYWSKLREYMSAHVKA